MRRVSFTWVILLVVVALLTVVIAFVFYPGPTLLVPLPVRAGEQEIAWLYPATAPTSWNRFIMALARAEPTLAQAIPGLRVRIDERTFPVASTTLPEAALEWPNGRRLVFRWYKTTSEQNVAHWLEALLKRDPPPLALLGGSTSDAAYRILSALREQTPVFSPERSPLMLLTTGTADRWISNPAEREAPVDLLELYPARTFRFCFSNVQMARATCDFIWSQPDLRPDSDPAYLIHWLDDAYSRDLVEGYLAALHGIAARATLEDQAWVLGNALVPGLGPFRGGVLPLHRMGLEGSNFRLAVPHSRQLIDSSVGTFTLANRFEVEVSKYLLLDLAAYPRQTRPLLAVTGQMLPCRRFLREIVRSDPRRGRQLVVTTGDAVPFTTLYRDRRTHWPIQDLPFDLVAFAHQNPIDTSAGFRPEGETLEMSSEFPQTNQAGTDDLLLLQEIVLAIGLALRDPSEEWTPATFARRLRALHYHQRRIVTEAVGIPFFDRRGHRADGTGEHLLCLRPRVDGDRVLPEALLEVFRWEGPSRWQRVGDPLRVAYDQPESRVGGP